MALELDSSPESIALDTAIRRMEAEPPFRTHAQDVCDHTLRLLDAMARSGLDRDTISELLKERVVLVETPEAREVFAGCCARAMMIRFGRHQ